MQRKLWKWIFSIFIVIVLISLATFLVLQNNQESDIVEDDKQKETYATAYSFNIPDTINILLGTNATLKTGYVTTTPIEAVSKVSYEIIAKSGSNLNGIKFDNNVIQANAVGNYTIKFKIPKSETTNFTKNISVNVYDNQASSHITQKINSIYINERLDLDTIFEIEEQNYIVETDSKIAFSNNDFIPLLVGESNVRFKINIGFIQYEYSFKLTIKEEPQYRIVLKNIENNTIEINKEIKPTAKIQISVVDKDMQHISQLVDAVSYNENVVRIISYTEPFINIEAVGEGETTILITYTLDKSVQIEVKIIVK